MRPARFSLLLVIVFIGAFGAGCAPDHEVAHRSAASIAEQAQSLAQPLPDLGARLAPTKAGWQEDGRSPVLDAALPTQADGDLRITPAGGGTHATIWRLQGGSPSTLEVDSGRAVYRDIARGADLVVTVEPERVETFFLLRDAEAPTTFAWKVELPRGLAVHRDGSDLSFVDRKGRSRLRVTGAQAVDAAGTIRAARLDWTDGLLSVALDATDLVHPILLDPAIEVVAWEKRSAGNIPPMRYSAMTFDSTRGRAVLFGGDAERFYSSDTWEWDGETWTKRLPAVAPPARARAALAFDPERGKAVLFGGIDEEGKRLGDTWEWDGTSWTRLAPAKSPSARMAHAMVYDSARKRVLLFGGDTSNARSPETWEWDGTNWTVHPVQLDGPMPRAGHALAFDDLRGKAILFGGFGPNTFLDDTWEWDGFRWTFVVTPHWPRASESHAMAFDVERRRVVLFGGKAPAGHAIGETWEFDGTDWIDRRLFTEPQERIGPAMAWDSARSRVVMFGGANVLRLDDTYEWDGTFWKGVGKRIPHPDQYEPPLMAFDAARNQTVLVDAEGPTRSIWKWTGTRWIPLPAGAQGPPYGGGAVMAFDAHRARMVLFGGTTGPSTTGQLGATWEWDGLNWVDREPAAGPSQRGFAAMVYDPLGQRMLLFGGVDNAQAFAETWAWDGVEWRQLAPTSSPPARYAHAMAYDSDRATVLLFGGRNGDGAELGDFWEWNGSDWKQLTPAVGPSARSGHAMMYDELRHKVVLFGGLAGNRRLGDTWEWDGTTWSERRTANQPGARLRHGLVWDRALEQGVMFGGSLADEGDNTWVLNSYGKGCDEQSDCGTGFCVDGVCCESACGGGATDDCLACSVMAGGSVDGRCESIPDGVQCSDANACTRQDLCRGGACVGEDPVVCEAEGPCHSAECVPSTGSCETTALPAGTSCGETSCVGSVLTMAPVCDGNGACEGQRFSCGTFACGTLTCRTSCESDAHCARQHVCRDHACVPAPDDAPASPESSESSGCGCSAGGGAPGAMLVMLALSALGRRRRGEPRASPR